MPIILINDFRFDEETGRMIPIEFGDGLNSSYAGYAKIHNAEEYLMYLRIIEKLAEKYQKITLLCRGPAGIIISQSAIELLKTKEFKDIEKRITPCFAGKDLGMGDFQFVEPEKLRPDIQQVLEKHTLDDCILVLGKEAFEAMAYAKRLNDYLKQKGIHTKVANSSDSIGALANNKFCGCFFGAGTYLKTELINSQKVDKRKIDRICQNAKHIVIKPTNASVGEGVIVTTPEELPLYLELLQFRNSLKRDPDNPNSTDVIFRKCMEKCKSLGFDYYSHQRALYYWLNGYELHSFFLLQEFVAGTPVEDYRVTGRLVYIVHDDLSIDFVDGFWKLPFHKLHTKVSETLLSISAVGTLPPGQPSALPISSTHLEAIKASAASIIRDIVGTALKSSLASHMEKMKASGDVDLQEYVNTILKEQMDVYIPDPKRSEQFIKVQTDRIEFESLREFKAFSSAVAYLVDPNNMRHPPVQKFQPFVRAYCRFCRFNPQQIKYLIKALADKLQEFSEMPEFKQLAYVYSRDTELQAFANTTPDSKQSKLFIEKEIKNIEFGLLRDLKAFPTAVGNLVDPNIKRKGFYRIFESFAERFNYVCLINPLHKIHLIQALADKIKEFTAMSDDEMEIYISYEKVRRIDERQGVTPTLAGQGLFGAKVGGITTLTPPVVPDDSSVSISMNVADDGKVNVRFR